MKSSSHWFLQVLGQSCRLSGLAQPLLRPPWWQPKAVFSLNLFAFCCTRNCNNWAYLHWHRASTWVMWKRKSVTWCLGTPYKFYISNICALIHIFPSFLYIQSNYWINVILSFSLAFFSQQFILFFLWHMTFPAMNKKVNCVFFDRYWNLCPLFSSLSDDQWHDFTFAVLNFNVLVALVKR